jgi:fermentation-respiration switch protein FrsA (DUF1100 family)
MHENAGNIGLRLDFYEALFHELKVNVVTFAYRGYSDSEGHPTETGLKLDADAIVDYVNNEPMINKQTVFIQGRSLGGAVALYTAAKYPHMFRGVIVENTFTSMSDMVDVVFFFMKHFKGLILRNYWTSIDLVGRITNPMLFITGNEDELVPFKMTLKLHESATASKHKELFVVFKGTHNDTWYVGGKEYMSKIEKFLKESMVYDTVQEKP